MNECSSGKYIQKWNEIINSDYYETFVHTLDILQIGLIVFKQIEVFPQEFIFYWLML